MSFSSRLASLVLIGSFLVGCSATVDGEKDSTSSAQAAIEVQSLNIESTQERRSGASKKSNLLGKVYTVRACLAMPGISKSMANRDVLIFSENESKRNSKTDSKGCVRWTHDITEEFQKMKLVFSIRNQS